MIALYNDSATCDFTLRCQEDEDISFRAHLFILVARSTYFEGLAFS